MSAGAFWILYSVMFAPIPAFAALLVTRARYPEALDGQHAVDAALYALALFAAFFSIACVRPISRLGLAAFLTLLVVVATTSRRRDDELH